jgi:hypothetical protein
MKKFNPVNHLAIELLEVLGNNEPSQQQIDVVERLLSMLPHKKISSLHKKLAFQTDCRWISAH